MKLFPSLHSWLLSLYYTGTLPYRMWRNARLYAAGKVPILVFFYHRIAADQAVPWSHTHDEFERQMLWLKEHFDLISLEEVQRRIRSQVSPRPAACITFDDGYAENCDRAIPFLVEQEIPCTYFVNTWFIQEQRPFPHDIALGKRLLPNTVQQLRYMAELGIEIGAHTRTHADMGKIHDLSEIRREISGCGDELEQMLGQRVRYFAFPYGLPRNMTSMAFRVAREHGYEGVCSAYGDYNYPGDDGFHIRRIHPDNMTVLRNWATFDPRKLGKPVAYDYRHDATLPQPVAQPTQASIYQSIKS
jgi:peptidoglycan/xylan/chitin deacetylase (PgdA/CDA1 family)